MKLRYLPFVLLLACSSDSTKKSTTTKKPERPAVQTNITPERCSADWQELEPGLRYRALGCSDTNSLDLHLVELDPALWTIDTSLGEPATSTSVARASGAQFAINANFFDEARRPLGVVVSGGVLKNPLHPVSWQSVFFVDRDGKAGVQPQPEWDLVAGSATAAVQCGPRLVINGQKNQVAQGDPSLRSGVCITPAQKVIFFATPQDKYFDVHEMVEFAADPNALGCRDAMLFDGGPSAQLYLDSTTDIAIEGDLVPSHVTAKRITP